MQPLPATAVLACLAAQACGAPERVPDEPFVGRVEVARDGRPGFASRTLFERERLSAHAVAASGSLPLHHHARHDETVYVVSGRARMRLGDETLELEPGMLVHVPAGVLHGVEVEGRALVLSLFTPPFDGIDRILAD